MTLHIFHLLAFVKIFHNCMAQQAATGIFPINSTITNTLLDTIGNLNIIANQTEPVASSIDTLNSGTFKQNDWWPSSEQQVTPYTPETQQSLPAYYIPAPPPPTPQTHIISNYRSEPWSPYGYPEFGYPVVPPAVNQLTPVTPRYMAIAIFIGLLTLFAIIQSSIMLTKRKDTLEVLHRDKRDLLIMSDFEHMSPEQQDILNNDAKIRCIQRTICQENSEILKDFGPRGVQLAKYLTQSIKKSLQKTSGWDRLVEDAGAAGLRGEDCSVLYRDCVLPAVQSRFDN